MPTIILTGGGTAGHCTPNVALLPYLRTFFDKIYYVGSPNGIEKEIALKNKLTYYEVTSAKLKRSFSLSNIKIPFKIIKGINQAKNIIKKLEPDVIFSKGGYVALPTVIAGYKLKIPVISHESDLSIGLANKIASKFSVKVLTSFPDTATKITNGEFVGPPLREELFKVDKFKCYDKFGFKNNKPVLLITGGSQGSKAINQATFNILPRLLKKFNVIHLCGKNNISSFSSNGYYQAEFLTNIEDAFAIADVCITRAGSNTLFELLAKKIPCVVIPLPKLESRGDQILNAEYFNKKKLINLLYQEELTSDTLLNRVLSTYENRMKYVKELNKLSFENSNKRIFEIIKHYANS